MTYGVTTKPIKNGGIKWLIVSGKLSTVTNNRMAGRSLIHQRAISLCFKFKGLTLCSMEHQTQESASQKSRALIYSAKGQGVVRIKEISIK